MNNERPFFSNADFSAEEITHLVSHPIIAKDGAHFIAKDEEHGDFWHVYAVNKKQEAFCIAELDTKEQAEALKTLLISMSQKNLMHTQTFDSVKPVLDVILAAADSRTNQKVNNTLFFGYGRHPYAFISELDKADVPIIATKEDTFAPLTNPKDIEMFLEYLLHNYGALDVT